MSEFEIGRELERLCAEVQRVALAHAEHVLSDHSGSGHTHTEYAPHEHVHEQLEADVDALEDAVTEPVSEPEHEPESEPDATPSADNAAPPDDEGTPARGHALHRKLGGD